MIETPETLDFKFIRSARRKRVAVRVWEGKVELLAPKRVSEEEAKDFLYKSFSWIQKKLREQANTVQYCPKQYVDGEIFLYLGEEYFLNIAYAKQPAVMLRDRQLFVFIRDTLDANKRKQQIYLQLRQWYWQRAEEELRQKSYAYAQKLGVQFSLIRIRQFKSRWGSCSTKGEIQYTWQIMLAPPSVVDYLVVHELCHLKHHNHSPRFWKLVASIFPAYQAGKNWLKTHGHLLKIE